MAESTHVVEDDPAALRLVSYRCESASHQIEPAVDGTARLGAGGHETPDLVAPGAMLPSLGGSEVRHRSCSSSIALDGHAPFLMLTARTRETDRAAHEKVCGDRYLTKPAIPQKITAAVQSLLAHRQLRDG